MATEQQLPEIEEYKYGFREKDVSVFRTKRGLTEDIVREISKKKNEPEWMLNYRLKGLAHFYKRPMPQWLSLIHI